MMTRIPVEENQRPDGGSPAVPRLVPDAPPRSWQAAEAGLYPMIMMDSDVYEVAVKLVAEAATVLRGQCDTVADLTGADAATILDRCPSTGAAAAFGVEPAVAFDAARAQCWRELAAKQFHGTAVDPAVDGAL